MASGAGYVSATQGGTALGAEWTGNGYVVEATNDVLNVFDASGHSVLPDNTATNIV